MTQTTSPISPSWLARANALRPQFASASPFPHLVLDDFLSPDLAGRLHDDFPSISRMPKSRDYLFGNKHELSSIEHVGAAGREVYDCLMSVQFREFLVAATGRNVFIDPMFHGGGFHQSGNKGFLDFHVDFNVHPLHGDWLRTLNVLLYLNRDWRPEYGGYLMLKNAIAAEPIEIAPVFNRAVIMLTGDATYHAVSALSVPEGVTRKSLAAYAYEQITIGAVRSRTTGWAPQGAGLTKRLLARYYDRLVRIKTRFLGSGTAKNR